MNIPMHNISPGLYLGSMMASQNLELLKANNITHILIAACDLQKHYPKEFIYHQIVVEDVGYEDMTSHFSGCIEFIEKGLKEGGVLVHCAAGISRSSTIVMAYLMQRNNWDMKTALDYTRQKRGCVCPNMSFQKQLDLYHKLAFQVDDEHPEVKELREQLQVIKSNVRPYMYYRY